MSGKKKLVAILLSLALLAGLVSPAAVAEPAEADWDYEADVVVVGAGGAGLPAALKALEIGRAHV